MEMKYVVPDMAQSFGTLEFAGESEPVFERDKNNRRVLARRTKTLAFPPPSILLIILYSPIYSAISKPSSPVCNFALIFSPSILPPSKCSFSFKWVVPIRNV